MKHSLIILSGFLMLLPVACTDRLREGQDMIAGQVHSEGSAYVPGVFRVKVSGSSQDLDIMAFTRSGEGSGNAEFDAAAVRAGAVGLSRVFSDGDRFRERRRKAGLHRWYDVHFNEDIEVGEAIARFGMPEGVVCVEPVYRMVPATDAEAGISSYIPLGMSSSPFNDPLQSNQWFMHNDGSLPYSEEGADINLFPAWTVETGSGEVIVAVADGGIDYTHPDLAANMWDDGQGHCGYNFNRNSYEIIPSSHGTHVAGIVSAVNNNGTGVCGIAGGDGSPGSGVKLMSCQVFDDVGAADIVDLMTWAADHGAVISQNSWQYTGLSDLSQSGKEAIDYFIRNAGCDENGNQLPDSPMKGGVVIFAAGNDSSAEPHFPAAYGPVIAVASLGNDYRKASSSNYGDWVDIAATGGDANVGDGRYSVYSTLPGGEYGFASGTSMACPQVSGIAALAVAKYGGPGFTADDLVQLLLASGRRELTESRNPEYAGQLGAGLIDAGYIFFKDEIPAPVTSVETTGRRCRIEMRWQAPSDYMGRAVTSYDIYVSAEPFSASSVDEIPSSADARHVETEVEEDGKTVFCNVDGLDPDTEYCIAVVPLGTGGRPSVPYVLTARTSNTAPEATGKLPDIYLSADDRAGVSVPLDGCFSDADMPDDRLSYFVSFPTGDIVNGRIEGTSLRLMPLSAGTVTLTVVASDMDGAAAGSPMRIIVDGTGAEADFYPNPCTGVLNMRIPGAEGDFPVRIYDIAGGLVLSCTVHLGQNPSGEGQKTEYGNFPSGSMDVSSLAPGRYLCETDYFGRTLSGHIIKR